MILPSMHPRCAISDPIERFQESLFDALGDDEGAAFWKEYIGQPIHNYPNTYVDEVDG